MVLSVDAAHDAADKVALDQPADCPFKWVYATAYALNTAGAEEKYKVGPWVCKMLHPKTSAFVWDTTPDIRKTAAQVAEAAAALVRGCSRVRGCNGIMGCNWHMVGTEAGRASLRHIISNEESIYSAIAEELRGIKMTNTVDRKQVVDDMLSINLSKFKEMNLGGRCWYLARIWNLITEFGECKKGFFDFVCKCNDWTIYKFVTWIIGPGYSCAHFVKLIRGGVNGLPPSLLAIVYSYLAVPPAHFIRREILRLI